MKITKADIGIGLLILAANTGIYATKCSTDHRRAEHIKAELREEVRKHDGFPSEMDIDIAEYREPFFDRTNYWEVTADSIRREMENEKAAKAECKIIR